MVNGDNLCVYTDGLIEVRNRAHEFFGPELFAPARLHDDATVVVLCRAEAGASPSPG